MWYNFLQREREYPGSLSSVIPMISALVLLILALASNANDSKALRNIYMMEIDISNINWDTVLPVDSSVVKSNWKSEETVQRHGLFSQCIGKGTGKSFDPEECSNFKKAFDVKYFIARSIRNVIGSWKTSPSSLNLPGGATVSSSLAGASIAFLVMATVWIGIAIIFNILDVKQTYVIKWLATIALFISNIITTVVPKKIVNALNDNQNEYGIKAKAGARWLSITWTAFAILLFVFPLEAGLHFYYAHKKNKQNKFDDTRRESELTNQSEFTDDKAYAPNDSKREVV